MARPDGKDRGLFQRPADSGVWWIRWTDQGGQEHREKIGAKSSARQAYMKRKEEVRQGVKLPDLKRRPLNVGNLLDQYLPEMLSGKKEKGVRAYRRQAEFWRGKLGDLTASEIQPGEIERIKSQLEKTMAPATVNRRLTFLRRLFTLAVRDQKMATNPISQGRVKLLREKNCKERFFSPEEEAAIKGRALPDFWLWVLLALYTGLRRGEQFGLKREHVDLARRSVWLEDTKAGEPQRMRLNSVAVAVLTKILADH